MDSVHRGHAVLEGLESRLLFSDGVLIVTDSSLGTAFQDVADWYTRKGYPAEVVTTSNIANAYEGTDLQEQIRNCVRDYRDNHDVGYVLLGGDNSIVPDRDTTVNVSSYVTSTMPTELYYASLEGTWDDDGDGVYGEAGQDNVLIRYDVVVARYPIRTPEHVATMLTKVMAYETAPPAQDWATRMLGTGTELWGHLGAGTHGGVFYDYDPSDAEVKTRAAYDQYVRNYWSQADADFLFDSHSTWDSSVAGDYNLTRDHLVEAMGNGYQFMHMATHGASSLWAMESGSYFSSSFVQGLSQAVNVPIVSTMACDTGGFDRADASLSEAFLRSDMTGTIAYLGCSRYGWGYSGESLGPSIRYSYQMYKEFLDGDQTLLGNAFAAGKEYFAGSSASNGAYRWVQLGLNLQGDPLVQMYRNDPVTMAPVYQSTVNAGVQQFQVSNLAEGARVCLWQGDGLYVVGQADAQGVFRAQVDPAAGTIQLTVVAPDAPVFVAEITVDDAPQPELPWQLVDGVLTVQGTSGDDAFSFQAGATTYEITLNGVAWSFDVGSVHTVLFHGLAGDDRVTLTGSSGADTATLRPGQVTLAGEGYLVQATSAETVRVFGGAGDRAYFYDSAGDDRMSATPTDATMVGPGFTNSAYGFEAVYAYSTAGGSDSARLFDSAGNDRYRATPAWAYMVGSGFFNCVQGFAQVNAYATAGGQDLAYLYDSAGNDVFSGTASYGCMAGSGFFNYAAGFDYVYAYATAGGSDTAHLYDSAGDDLFCGAAGWSYLRGQGFYQYAAGFDQVRATATAGGSDTAYFFDSAGDDTFWASPTLAYLRGLGFANFATGFDQVRAYATAGGLDTAYFFDSAGDDRFYASPSWSYMMGEGFCNYVSGFERGYAYSSAGGDDLAALYDSAGDDTFVGRPGYSALYGEGFYRHVTGFGRVYAYATAGGSDKASLYDSAGDDWFYGTDSYSAMLGDNYANLAWGFETSQAYATAGGFDRAYLYDSAGDDRFHVSRDYSYMQRPTNVTYARGFGLCYGYSTRGGADEARFFDVGDDDSVVQGNGYSFLSADGTGFLGYAMYFASFSTQAA